MAKRSSRKSSSGDEALLWGIAAVVVAVAGVGAAIMLTRSKSVCGDVQCSKNQDKNPKPTSKTDCCVNKPEPAACTVQGGNGTCTSQVNSQGKRNCVGGNQLCGVNLDAHKNAHSDEDTCDKIFNNYKDKMIRCNTGYTASVEKDGQNNCLFKCATQPAAPKKPAGPKKPAACTVQGGNGTCMSQVNSQGKRNCVGGNQLCGVNLAAHTNAHSDEDTCDKIFNKYKDNMIKCNTGYTASVEKDGQNNCLFKCGSTPAAPKKPKKKKKQAGQCCAPSGLAEGVCGATTTEEKCRGSCVWNPNGCIKENFRMRRWRR
tara:strand:+ start:23300 stop:24244 length:945 start_codon:yes stop_codon:yes gene_type:complete